MGARVPASRATTFQTILEQVSVGSAGCAVAGGLERMGWQPLEAGEEMGRAAVLPLGPLLADLSHEGPAGADLGLAVKTTGWWREGLSVPPVVGRQSPSPGISSIKGMQTGGIRDKSINLDMY